MFFKVLFKLHLALSDKLFQSFCLNETNGKYGFLLSQLNVLNYVANISTQFFQFLILRETLITFIDFFSCEFIANQIMI